VIRELLGYADLGSIEIDTHVAISRAQAMLRDLHPMNDDTGAE
jgi:integrase/recombinase XerD